MGWVGNFVSGEVVFVWFMSIELFGGWFMSYLKYVFNLDLWFVGEVVVFL